MPESLKSGLRAFGPQSSHTEAISKKQNWHKILNPTPCCLDPRPSDTKCFGQGLCLVWPCPSLPICTVTRKAQPETTGLSDGRLRRKNGPLRCLRVRDWDKHLVVGAVRRCCPEMDASCRRRCWFGSCCSYLLLLLELSKGMHVLLATTVRQGLPLPL